jgi:hypothetical protein
MFWSFYEVLLGWLLYERVLKQRRERALRDPRQQRETNKQFLKFVICLAGFFLLLSLIGSAFAQQRTYQDSMGRNTGRSVTTGGNTTFYDNMGRNTGRSVTRGNTITVYDNMGRQTGNITTKPQGR